MINDLADLAIIETMYLRERERRDDAETDWRNQVGRGAAKPGIDVRIAGLSKRFGDRAVLQNFTLDMLSSKPPILHVG